MGSFLPSDDGRQYEYESNTMIRRWRRAALRWLAALAVIFAVLCLGRFLTDAGYCEAYQPQGPVDFCLTWFDEALFCFIVGAAIALLLGTVAWIVTALAMLIKWRGHIPPMTLRRRTLRIVTVTEAAAAVLWLVFILAATILG